MDRFLTSDELFLLSLLGSEPDNVGPDQKTDGEVPVQAHAEVLPVEQ